MLMQKKFSHSSEKAYFRGSKVKKLSLSYRKILMKKFGSPVKHPLFDFQQIVLNLSDRLPIQFYNKLLTQTTAEHTE